MTLGDIIKKALNKGADYSFEVSVFWFTEEGDSIWLDIKDLEVYKNQSFYPQNQIILRVKKRL